MKALTQRARGSRQQSQAIVEFGIIALLFTGLMFATVDFGLLLNTWLSVSSNTREIARNASVGKNDQTLLDQASKLAVPSVSAAGFAHFCCDAASAIEVRVEYFTGTQLAAPCPPWGAACVPIPKNSINPLYPAGVLGTSPPATFNGGGSGSCPAIGAPPVANCRPLSDDLVRVTVIAHGAQIITPLLRPAFGCINGNNPKCYVPLTSTAIVRFEGAEF